jgi:hypothetical protein
MITPSTALSGTDWQWHVNGNVQQGQDSSIFFFTPALPGFYAIYLTVLIDGVLYSGSVNVTVTQ